MYLSGILLFGQRNTIIFSIIFYFLENPLIPLWWDIADVNNVYLTARHTFALGNDIEKCFLLQYLYQSVIHVDREIGKTPTLWFSPTKRGNIDDNIWIKGIMPLCLCIIRLQNLVWWSLIPEPTFEIVAFLANPSRRQPAFKIDASLMDEGVRLVA